MTANDTAGQAVSATQANPGRAPKLMVVDDQAGITRIVSRAAADLGFDTKEVNDANLATEAFIAFKPDILVLDLIMPGKDGLDILNEVLVVDPALKLVLISGHGETYLRLGRAVSKFHRESDVHTLQKPFRADALRDVLAKLIEG